MSENTGPPEQRGWGEGWGGLAGGPSPEGFLSMRPFVEEP